MDSLLICWPTIPKSDIIASLNSCIEDLAYLLATGCLNGRLSAVVIGCAYPELSSIAKTNSSILVRITSRTPAITVVVIVCQALLNANP